MKPPEILSMIEEAAGTRMFEERKEKALKTIAKKEKKVAEITQLLAEEIVPKLDKLRGEKRAYLEFQKTQTEIERLSRIVVSFDYSRFEVWLGGISAGPEVSLVSTFAILTIRRIFTFFFSNAIPKQRLSCSQRLQ